MSVIAGVITAIAVKLCVVHERDAILHVVAPVVLALGDQVVSLVGFDDPGSRRVEGLPLARDRRSGLRRAL